MVTAVSLAASRQNRDGAALCARPKASAPLALRFEAYLHYPISNIEMNYTDSGLFKISYETFCNIANIVYLFTFLEAVNYKRTFHILRTIYLRVRATH